MSQPIKISEKYEPLFSLPDNVDIYIVTGGRNSQKSFATGLATCINTIERNHRVLYTRYTMVSADDSIIPEFTEKIYVLNWEHRFDIKQGRITISENEKKGDKNKRGKIVFKGLKPSSGKQTANLKSLKDFSMFIVEEAEEIPTFEEWDKICKSIRSVDVKPVYILILNPALKSHWVYEKFFEEKGIKEGFNGIVDNVCYIHTSYLDCPREFIPNNIWAEFETKRIIYETVNKLSKEQKDELFASDPKTKRDYNYYKHVVLGGWLNVAEGVIYEDWEIGEFKKVNGSIFGLDFGSNDPDACVEVSVDEKEKKIYLREVFFQNNLSTSQLIRTLDKTVGKGPIIIADSAGKRSIADLWDEGFEIEKCLKKQVDYDIKTIQGYTLIVDPSSKNLQKALNYYRWAVNKAGVPNHDWSDLCDAFRYAVMYIIRGGRGGGVF